MNLFKKKEPQPILVQHKQLQCPVCQNQLFWAKRVQLNTSVATLFGLDWANRSAQCFICSECTYIFWFQGQR
jgi:hypothetical protein